MNGRWRTCWPCEARTGFRVPLIAGFVGSMEYEIDHDSRPAVEAKTTDETVRLKLGYEW
ncbi:DUF481 domain-containing protein [uncultured Thiohalocapsa sp.]|uniref:DUF481 domain-containing protein n=1 Tax=uncultured Thiohalocapsa sp. TaxID=768990 RepID=UPI0025EFF539|nr:DUF481 domain-containing protein [uncultured Thiohalocapsa sp.]